MCVQCMSRKGKLISARATAMCPCADILLLPLDVHRAHVGVPRIATGFCSTSTATRLSATTHVPHFTSVLLHSSTAKLIFMTSPPASPLNTTNPAIFRLLGSCSPVI